MRSSSLSALALLFFALAPLGAKDGPGPATMYDWPQWRGPKRDGVSMEKGLLKEWPKDGPKLLRDSRKVNSGKSVGTGYSSVSVSGGKLITQGDRDKKGWVYALDTATGKHLWATPIGQTQGDGPRCTPTVDGELLYALTRQGELACLKTADGSVVWTKNYKKNFDGRNGGWDFSESPLVDGDKLIITPGGDSAALAALDKRTGEVLWKSLIKDTGGAGYASVVIAEVDGIRQYITLLGRGIVGINASDGKLLWRYNRVTNGTANIPTPIVKGDLVFCSTGYGTGAALLKLVPDGKGGVDAKEQYFLRGDKLQNHHGGMVLIGDYIYGGHGHTDGQPFCLEMKSGKFAWGPQRNHPGEQSAGVVFVDGMLYFRWENGTVGLIEATPSGYKLASSFELPNHISRPGWPHPVVANGCLFIRGNDCVLCYDVKNRGS